MSPDGAITLMGNGPCLKGRHKQAFAFFGGVNTATSTPPWYLCRNALPVSG
jgi:hypothetical protein